MLKISTTRPGAVLVVGANQVGAWHNWGMKKLTASLYSALRERGERATDPFEKYWSGEAGKGGMSPGQRRFHTGQSRKRALRAANQVGKALKSSEPVLTPTGWRPIGSLSVGDAVIAGDGTSTQVIGVYPQGAIDLFRLTFADGSTSLACANHRWLTACGRERFGASRGNERWVVRTTGELLERCGESPKGPQRAAMPAVLPVQFAPAPLPVDPYLLGALLGDGSLQKGAITLCCPDVAVIERASAGLPQSDEFGPPCSKGLTYRLRRRARTHCAKGYPLPTDTMAALRGMGIDGKRSWEKAIPAPYMLGSVEQRTDLLRGLMDTDGTCTKTGCATYTSVSLELAEGVRDLVRSLGGKARVTERQTHFTYKGVKKPGRVSFRVRIRLQDINPFHLPRKAARWFPPTSTTRNRVLLTIEPAGRGDATCIAVAHPDRTFVTRDYLVTHNSVAGAFEDWCHALGRHPFREVAAAPTHGVIIIGIVSEHWSVISRKLREVEPRNVLHPSCQYIEGKGYTYRGRSMVALANGSTMTPKSGKQSVVALAGSTVSWLHADEPMRASHWGEAMSRVAVKQGPVWLTFTPVDVGQSLIWLRHKLELTDGHEADHDPGWSQTVIQLNTEDCPHRTEEDIREQMSVYLEWERVQRTTGGWEGISGGRRLANFDGRQTFPWTGFSSLPGLRGSDLRVGLAGDHGERAGAEYWLLYVYTLAPRHVWVLAEYESPTATTVERDASHLKELLTAKGLAVGEVDRWTGDVNSSGKGDSPGVRVNELFERELGLRFGTIETPKKGAGSVEWGTRVLNYALGADALHIEERCSVLLECVRRWEGTNIGNDKDRKHAIDSLRYGPGEVLEDIMPGVALRFRS